jgi:predicted transcriptional regulator
MGKENQELWTIRARPSWKKMLDRVAETVDRPTSQLVREAVNEKLERMAEQNPRIAEIVNEQAA